MRAEPQADKWAMLWGRPPADASLGYKLRILALPSLPHSRRLSPGVGAPSSWAAAVALLGGLLALIHVVASVCDRRTNPEPATARTVLGVNG